MFWQILIVFNVWFFCSIFVRVKVTVTPLSEVRGRRMRHSVSYHVILGYQEKSIKDKISGTVHAA
jgi:hypothetical protein